jgi:lipopolysaccharide biosynthesis glycosyltransferase
MNLDLPDNGTINIAFCSNDVYLKYIPVLIYSILSNHKSGEPVHFYVFCTNYPEKAVEKINKTVAYFNAEVSYITPDETILEENDMPKVKGFYASVYKMILDQYLSSIDRVLYFDVSAFVFGDISEFYFTNLDGMPLAGVPDNGAWEEDGFFQEFVDIEQKLLNCKNEKYDKFKYINTGLVLYDLKQIRHQFGTLWNALLPDINHLKECGVFKDIFLTDQSLINYTFFGQIKILDRRFNYSVALPYQVARFEKTLKSNASPVVYKGCGSANHWTVSSYLPVGKKFIKAYTETTKISGDLGYEMPTRRYYWENKRYPKAVLPVFIQRLLHNMPKPFHDFVWKKGLR